MRRTAIHAFCACAIVAFGSVYARDSSAFGDSAEPPPEKPAMTPGLALTLGPSQTIDVVGMDIPAGTAVAGQVTQLTNLTLHNALGTTAREVFYTVTDETHGTVLASGVVPHIPAKGNVTIAAVDLTPALGASTITFSASGLNNKSTTKTISKTVFAAAPGMELRALSAGRAITASSSTIGCAVKASVTGSGGEKLHASALASTRCVVGAGKGSFVLFNRIKLKNGWKIAQVVTTENLTGGSTWAFTAGPPAVGLDSAEMKIDMNVTTGASANVEVTVYVQGPAGSVPL